MTWRAEELAGRARAGLRAAIEGVARGEGGGGNDGGGGGRDAASDGSRSSRRPVLAFESVRVHVEGDVDLRVTAADGGGPPPMLWKLLSRALARRVKALVEEALEEALREVLRGSGALVV